MSSPEMANQPPDGTQENPESTPQTNPQPARPPMASRQGGPTEGSTPRSGPRPPFVSREERDRRRREALQNLVVGEWREGKVTGIAQFGAFVDLGGVDGLVHVSQLGTGGYVERVEDVVQVGSVVRVRVAEVDLERGRVSLSMREPRPAAAPARERPAAPATPRPPRPAGQGFTPAPAWTPETPPEPRHDRRSRGAPDRQSQSRGEERPGRRAERSGGGGRKPRDYEDEDWRSIRGDPRSFYSSEDEVEEEPAPTTAEELVARFGRRGTTK